MNITITKKLWLSSGVLIFILVMSGLISYWQVGRINWAVNRIAQKADPFEEAALEMEINVEGAAEAVLRYVRDQDAENKERIHNSETDFEHFAAEFQRLAESDEEKRLGEEIITRYNEFKHLGGEIVTLAEQRRAALQLFREDIKELDALVDDKLQKSIDRTAPDAVEKLEAALDMEINIDEAFVAIEAYILQRDPQIVEEVLNEQAAFNSRVEMYRKTTLSADEERWLDQIDRDFAKTVQTGNGIMATTDRLDEKLSQFETNLAEIDKLLDEQIQPLIHIETARAAKDAKASTDAAATLFLVLGFIGIGVASASAWSISRGIINPVLEMVKGTEIIGRGMLENRINIKTEDELGQLAVAFNRMTDSLRTSRRELERQAEALKQEIIERARAEEEIRILNEELEQRVIDRTRELSALYEVTAIGNEALDLKMMLDRSLKRVLVAMRSNTGAIHLLDETGQILHLAAHQGIPSDVIAQINSIPSDSEPVKWVLEHREPLIIPDMESDPQVLLSTQSSGFRTYVTTPMRAGGQAMGVLSILSAEKQRFNVEEVTLLTSIADQVAVVTENMRLRQQAKKTAVMEERSRLARELHDSVTQSLYSLILFTGGGQRAIRAGALENIEEYLADLGEIALQALKEMRLLVYELRPAILERQGLVGALQQRLDLVEKRAGVEAHLLADDLVQLPPLVEEHLYRIIQEALNNALKHASATSVTVHISVDGDELVLEVTDNGTGFDPDAVGDMGGMGLASIQKRVDGLGGTLAVLSTPREGVRIKVSMEVPQ